MKKRKTYVVDVCYRGVSGAQKYSDVVSWSISSNGQWLVLIRANGAEIHQLLYAVARYEIYPAE